MNRETNAIATAPVFTTPTHASAGGSIARNLQGTVRRERSRSHARQVHSNGERDGNGEVAAATKLRDELILNHLPLVKAIAIRMRQSLPAHVPLEDMVQDGAVGLFQAASNYDPEKHVVFSVYAKYRIKGAILDSLRQLDWASRDMRRRQKQVEAARYELAATLQHAPMEAELAEKLNINVEDLRIIMLDLRNVGPVSAGTRSCKTEDLASVDFPGKPEDQPESICARTELRKALTKAVQILPERHRQVVLLYYYNELTMKDIGEVLGINQSRVSQIHRASLKRMATELETGGITSSQGVSS